MALSGHGLVQRTCPLLTQSGHRRARFNVISRLVGPMTAAENRWAVPSLRSVGCFRRCLMQVKWKRHSLLHISSPGRPELPESPRRTLMPSLYRFIRTRVTGALLMALGIIALLMPQVAGRWSLAFLGVLLIAVGIAETYAAFRSARSGEASSYLEGLFAALAGTILSLSSALVLDGLLILLIAILLADGLTKIFKAWRKPGSDRFPLILNGFLDFGCAATVWYLSRFVGVASAVGIAIGLFIVAAGWRMILAPAKTAETDAAALALDHHPDPGLRIPGN